MTIGADLTLARLGLVVVYFASFRFLHLHFHLPCPGLLAPWRGSGVVQIALLVD